MGKRAPVRTKAKLREAANEHMTLLEQSPERVRAYFQDRLSSMRRVTAKHQRAGSMGRYTFKQFSLA